MNRDVIDGAAIEAPGVRIQACEYVASRHSKEVAQEGLTAIAQRYKNESWRLRNQLPRATIQLGAYDLVTSTTKSLML